MSTPAPRRRLNKAVDARRTEADGDVDHHQWLLEQARARVERLAAVRRTGDLTPLVEYVVGSARLEDGLDDLVAVVDHLEPTHVRALLGGRHKPGVEAVLAKRLEAAAGRPGPELAELVRLVLTTPGWTGDRRVDLVLTGCGKQVQDKAVAVAHRDARLAVLLGMHVGQLRDLSLRHETSPLRVQARLRAGAMGDRYRLGEAFRGGLDDPELELELVELLATLEPVAVAARLAAAMPPLGTARPTLVAQRLADLEALTAGVASDPGH